MHSDASNGHFSHNHTIPPTDSTPQRPKRAAQHDVTAKGTAGTPIFHQFPASRYPRRPLRAPRHNPTTERRPSTAETRNPAENSQQGTAQHPLSLTATIPIGHSAHRSTKRPPNNAAQRPKRATRHRMATERYSPMAEICNPTQRGRGAARQTPASAETRLPGDEICTYNR